MSPRPKKVLINSHKQHKNCQSSSVPQPRGEIRRDHPTAVRRRPISERHSSKIRRPVRHQTKPSKIRRSPLMLTTPKFRWNCQTRLDKQPHPKSADIERNRGAKNQTESSDVGVSHHHLFRALRFRIEPSETRRKPLNRK